MLTLPLIAMLSLGFSFQPVRAEPETRLYVDPPTCEGGPGDSFTVNISVADVDYLYGWQLKLYWNPNLLNATSLEEGPFLKDAGETRLGPQPPISPINNTLGRVQAVCTLLGVGAYDAPSGSGTLASVTFIVKAAGECPLNLTDTELYTMADPSKPGQAVEIPHSVEDGYYIIPEFPTALLLPLFLILTLIAVAVTKKIRYRKQ